MKAIAADIGFDCSLVVLDLVTENPIRRSNRATDRSEIVECPMVRNLAGWDCSLADLADTIVSNYMLHLGIELLVLLMDMKTSLRMDMAFVVSWLVVWFF